MADGAFKIWHRKGLKCFDDLYIDNSFASFSQMTETFGIAKTHFFRFLQIRDFIQHLTAQFPCKPPVNPVDIFLSVNPTSRGIMFNLYNLISKLHCSSTAAMRTAWEQDLNFTFTEDTWDSVLDRIYSSSMCARHALLQFKVVHHIHISKTKLARMYPDVDPTCDKCKGAPASLYHMYWTCPL